MSTVAHYVSRGLSRVAESPMILRAVVGPGFVVCVRTRDEMLGGMVHVESGSLNDDATAERVFRRVNSLLSEMEKSGAELKGAIADIVGGADILHIYPRHLRQEIISAEVDSLTRLLESKKIRIRRVRVGGAEARRVEMTLPGKDLEVRSVSRPRRERIEQPPSRLIDNFGDSGPGNRPSKLVVNMGCMEVAESPTQLVALLGSCVGIALYDPETRVGGLAHVMLPSSEHGNGKGAKFADTAVPALLESISHRGGSPSRAVAKLAGGANVLKVKSGSGTNHIGRANIESALQSLNNNGIDLIWQDTGGKLARKMSVSLRDFDISIRFIESTTEG